MNIQGTAVSSGVPLPTVPDGDETPLDPRPPAGSELEEPAEREPDRIELSVRALRKVFVGRFRQIVRSALERPEKLDDHAQKKLRKEFHEALRALKRAGIHDQSEVNTLRKAFRDAQSSLEPAHNRDVSEVRIEARSEARVSESSTYSLEIQTADGDSVSIQLAREDRLQYSAEFSKDGQGSSALTTRLQASSASALTFRVEGELDEEEHEAIRQLVGQVDELAVKFFQGDVQAALDHALQFGFNDPEIASFSLELGYSLEAYAATSYRAIQTLAAPEAEADLAPAIELRDEVNELISQVRLETFFLDARSLVLNFFQGALETDPQIEAGDEGRDLRSVAERFFDAIPKDSFDGAVNDEDG